MGVRGTAPEFPDTLPQAPSRPKQKAPRVADQDLTIDATLLGGEGTLGGATMAQTDELLEHARRSTARPELPGYTLTSRLGAGTFGEAWAGEQLSTGQRVAVKVITRSASLDILRFRQEVQRLIEVAEHPNVVTLLDANLDHIPPFFVMPLLASSLAETQGPPAQVAVWFEQVAEGLRYIHSKGILHGDLKPANLLLDGEGRARLADFGQSFATQDGGYNLGTIGFMAPEQIQRALRRNQLAADERWDVYALGASIYKLLTGEIPRLDSRARASLATIGVTERLQICVELSQAPLKPVRSLNKAVDHDLAAIVENCLEVIPNQRYADVTAVLTDLRRRQDQLPLLGLKPWTPGYRARSFNRRYREGVRVAALGITLLLGSVFFGWWQIRQQAAVLERERQQMDEERQTNEKAQQEAADQISKLVDLEANFAGLAARKGHLDEAALWWGRALNYRPDDQAMWLQLQSYPFGLSGYVAINPAQNALALAPGGRLLATWGDGNATLWNLDKDSQHAVTHPPGVRLAQFSPDGKTLATAAEWGEVRLWHSLTGQPLQAVTVRAGASSTRFVSDPASQRLTALAFSPSSRRLATGAANGEVCLFDLRTPKKPERFRVRGAVQELALPDQGPPLVVTRSGEGYLGGRPLGVSGARHVGVKGNRGAFFGSHSTLVSLPDGAPLARLGRAEAGNFWEGRVIAAGPTVSVWDARTGRARTHWQLPEGYRPLAVSPTGDVAAIQADAVRAFDPESGQPVSGFLWHRARVEAAAFAATGQLGTLAGGRARVFQPQGQHGYRPQWHRKGDVVAVSSKYAAMADRHRLLVAAAENGQPAGRQLTLSALPDYLTWVSPEALLLKTGTRLWHWNPTEVWQDPESVDVVAAAVVPWDSQELPKPEAEPAEPKAPVEEPLARVISAEGREVRITGETFLQPRPPRALSLLQGQVCLADERQLQIGRPPKPLASIPGRFDWLGTSGNFLVAGERRRLVLVERREQTLSAITGDGSSQSMTEVSFGKVGAADLASDILCHALGEDLVVVGTRSGKAQAYRLGSPLPVLGEPLQHQAAVVQVALGKGVAATADADGRIYLWTVPQSARVFASRPGAAVTSLAFAPNGDLFVSAGGETTCWRFPARVCAPDQAERFAEHLTGFTLDSRQNLRPLSPQEWRERAPSAEDK